MKTRDLIESSKSFGVKINKIIIREHLLIHQNRSKIFLETTIDEYWTDLENHAFRMDSFNFDVYTQTLTLEV